MVLLVEVIHRNADSVERPYHFAYVLHTNADSVEKSCHFAYVLHPNADSVEKSCYFAYVLHTNAESVEKSFSADMYIASFYVVNPLSGKSPLYHTPAAQRVRKNYR